jgi:pimeloyl-ACP methyl ester carboxylesterase
MPRPRPVKDIIVIIPGITGSALATRGASGDSRDIWSISGGALWNYLSSFGRSLDSLRVSRHDPRTEVPETAIVPTKVIRGFHGIFGLAQIDGYARLIATLTTAFGLTTGANLIEFPYDWRMSCRYSAKQLQNTISRPLDAWRERTGEPDAKVVIVAHSLGGLVARYWLEVLEGWRDCRLLATFGTPYRGSVDTLEYVANGYKRTFVDLTEVLRSCPSVYELIPFYRCVLHNGDWRRPSTVSLPRAEGDYVAAGADFHAEIRSSVEAHMTDRDYIRHRYRIFPFVGVKQSTLQSAQVADGRLTTSGNLPDWIDQQFSGGDGRVPRPSATPLELSDEYRETFLAEQHGSLQNNGVTLDDLVERIAQAQSRRLGEIRGSMSYRMPAIDVQADDLYLAGEPVVIRATPVDWAGELQFRLAVEPETLLDPTQVARSEELTTNAAIATTLSEEEEGQVATFEGLAAGRYRLTVAPGTVSAASPRPVTAVFEVAG